MIVVKVNYEDVKHERECFGRYDKQHNFCLNTCAVRYGCKKNSKKVK